MKTKKPKEAFPSPMRLFIYLALVAALCTLSCLTAEAKDRPGEQGSKEKINNVKLTVVQYSLPDWLIGAYLEFVLQTIGEKSGNEASDSYLMEIARANSLTNFRSLNKGTAIVFPPFDKSSN